MIKFYPTDSSQMTALGYVKDLDGEGGCGVLCVQFNTGKYYRYSNVRPKQVIDILFADSVGKAFNEIIKAKPLEHPYTEITAEEAFAL